MILIGISVACPVFGEERPAAEPRATMHQVFEALSLLLPASLSEGALRDPAQRDHYQLAFERLAQAAGRLADHGDERDAIFQTLSRSLEDDAEDAASLYARGRIEEAAFQLQQLTGRCVACHARLPSAREFPLADRLMSQSQIGELSAEERARLYVATRRFDSALGTWEALFAQTGSSPAWLDRGGQLVDYLTVAVRVTQEQDRAAATLRKIARRSDTPAYLRSRLGRWAEALAPVPEATDSTGRVAEARAFLERAESLNDFPSARDGLVLELRASAVLQQYVHDNRTAARPAEELAEAFYLLGVIEARTAWSYWIPQTESYMEAALRAAPGGPRSEQAYERIEETLLTDYGAATAAELPDAERERLTALRRLMGHADEVAT
jgi:tetratricopeptide (TPR) repeat protein